LTNESYTHSRRESNLQTETGGKKGERYRKKKDKIEKIKEKDKKKDAKATQAIVY
jgi:hypothetical protein